MLRWAVAPEHLLQSHENLSYFSSNWPQLSRSRQLSDLVSCALTETEGHRLLSLSFSLSLASCFLSVIFCEFQGYSMTTDAHGPHIHRSFAGRKIPDGSCSTKRLKFSSRLTLIIRITSSAVCISPEMLNLYFILLRNFDVMLILKEKINCIVLRRHRKKCYLGSMRFITS